MASSLNEANLEKKLTSVTNTQESIQTLSLWCIHHKAHYKKIVEMWLKVIKKTKPSHRLALFYLANDVIQNSKRKGNSSFQDAWNVILKDAIPFVKDDKIRPQIERIFNVWESRSVYDSDFIGGLKAMLGKTSETKGTIKARGTANAKLLAEFKPQKLVDKIRKVKKIETESELKHKLLTTMKIDVSSTETLRQLKDRAHGDKFSQEFEDGTVKLSDYVQFLEQEVEEKTGLIELLEKGEMFYDTQRGEAKIVANAYKNFGSRVKNLKKRLDEMKAALPSPIPSPTHDAPSPVDSSVGGTPVLDTNKDNTEAIDMEMSDEEAEGCTLRLEDPDVGSPGSAPSPEGSPVGLDLPSSSPLPNKRKEIKIEIPANKGSSMMTSLLDTVSGSVPALSSKNSMSLDSRLSNLMQNIPNLSPAMHSGLFDDQSGLIPLPQSVFSPAVTDSGNEGGGTPLKDEGSATGSATPLQDEEREASNPVKLLSKIMLKIGASKNTSSPTVTKSQDRSSVQSNAWDNNQVTHVQVDQNSKASSTAESENMSISEFFKKIGSSLAGTQPSGGTKREWSFPKTSHPQVKRSANTPIQTPVPAWFPKSSSFDSFTTSSSGDASNTGVTSQNAIDPSHPINAKQARTMDSSDRPRPDMAPSLIPSQLAERKPSGDGSTDSFTFRNELLDPLSPVGENLPLDRNKLLDPDSLHGLVSNRQLAAKRNSKLVESAPSAVRTGGFNNEDGDLRNSSNLITLVQSVDEVNPKTASNQSATAMELGQYGSSPFDFQSQGVPSFQTDLQHLPPVADNDAMQVQNSHLPGPAHSLKELSMYSEETNSGGQPDNMNDHLNRITNIGMGAEFPRVAATPLNSLSTLQTLAGGEETTYSRIETVGTRRDSMEKRRFANDADMYHRRYDMYDRRPEWEKYPPQNHGFQRPWMPKENWDARGFKSFPQRPRFGPGVPNRYPPPPHQDGRRPFYASRH